MFSKKSNTSKAPSASGMESQTLQGEDNCDVTSQPSHSIKQMKEELLDLMTSFRGNQAEWWGDNKKDSHGNQFEQLLEVCHLQYEMAHSSVASLLPQPPNSTQNEEDRKAEEKKKLSEKFDQLSRKLTSMTNFNE